MDKLLLIPLLSFLALSVGGQQLYLEAWASANTTAYELTRYETSAKYLTYGGRLAAGADHFQIGAEYFTNYSNPVFESSLSSEEFDESYYGAFLRTNISRFPAMRFGLVLRAGAGFHTSDLLFSVPPGSSTALTESYEPYLGFNGGVGFSVPLFRATMLQLGYTYYYVTRPDLDSAGIPSHKANVHSFQAGLSLNFVFGERAKQYREIRKRRLNVGD